jgi:hypothetical protein
MRIVVFHNIATDDVGRSEAWLGYRPGHPLVPVYVLERLEVEQSPSAVAEMIYHLLNVGDDPQFGIPHPDAVAYRTAKNRSLSVGDVVLVGDEWWACASMGFERIEAPRWLAVGVGKHGTTPLESRRWSPPLPLNITVE